MPRITRNLEIAFQYSGRFEWSSLLNLSGGGVFIKTNHPLPVDSTLTMQITLPGDSELLDIEGRVVWVKQKINSPDAGMDMEFSEISMQHQEKITYREGRAVWIKQNINSPDPGMGIEFTKISTQHQKKITSFVESYLREAQENHASKMETEAATLLLENKE